MEPARAYTFLPWVLTPHWWLKRPGPRHRLIWGTQMPLETVHGSISATSKPWSWLPSPTACRERTGSEEVQFGGHVMKAGRDRDKGTGWLQCIAAMAKTHQALPAGTQDACNCNMGVPETLVTGAPAGRTGPTLLVDQRQGHHGCEICEVDWRAGVVFLALQGSLPLVRVHGADVPAQQEQGRCRKQQGCPRAAPRNGLPGCHGTGKP